MESPDLDKLFRDAFEQAEETPNNRVWEGIEQELAQEKKIIPFYRKYRTALSIAATFILFFGIGLTFYKKPTPSGKEKIEEILASVKKENKPAANTVDNTPIERNRENTEIEKTINSTKEQAFGDNTVAKQQVEVVSATPDRAQDKRDMEEEKLEILATDQLLATVDIDLTITPAYTEEIKAIEPISNDLQHSFAFAAPKEDVVKSSLVTRVLNGITRNILTKSIDLHENKEIEFKNDDEGSITLSIFNSFARK